MPRARLWYRLPDEGRDGWRAAATQQLGARGWQPASLERAPAAGLDVLAFDVPSLAGLDDLRRELTGDSAWREAATRAALAVDDRQAWGLGPLRTQVVAEEAVIVGGTRSGNWLNIDAHDGLPSVLINDIDSLPDGRLCLATYEGLCLFDGTTARMLRDPDGVFRWAQRVALMSDGTVWIGPVGQSLLRLRGEVLEWFDAVDGLPVSQPSCLAVDGAGRLWVGGGGLARFEEGCFRPVEGVVPAGARVHSIGFDDDLGLLLGCDVGAFRWDGERATQHTPAVTAVNAFVRDRHGDLWIGAESGLYRDGEEQPVLGDAVHRMLPDVDGGLWAATPQQGVIHLSEGQRQTYSTGSGLSSNQPRSLHQDRRGCLWVGAWGGGLSRYDGCWIRTLGEAQGLPPCRIETLCEGPDGRIWIGTWGQGVLRQAGDRLEPVAELDAYGPELWSSLLDRDGRLWFGTYRHGAVCVDGDTITPFGRTEGLGHDSVWGMHQDRRGRLWFATQGGGLTCLDGRQVTTYTTADGLPHDSVWAVTEDADGAIWCSTFDSGVCRFDGSRFERFTSLDGLAHDQVWCILPDADGDLWFGTWGGGASRWDGTGFTTYTTRDGLANNSVRALHQSRDGHLWFGTFGGGLTRFDGHAFQTLSRREGLVHDAVQGIVDDAGGRVWIATEGGITVYTPPTEPPTVRLGDIVADRRYRPEDDVVLTTKQHLVTFEFAGASFSTVRERLVYAWRLRGRFDEWRTTTRRRAEVRDLPAGHYTFEVCAVDRDLNWSEPVAREIAVDVDAGADRLQALQAELAGTPEVDPFIGRSPSLARVLDQIDVVAPSDLTVLIQGETGTGKGLAAHALHSLSPRREGPFLQVNCGALPEGLVESELFGHEKGAFTGAVTRRIGRFELAEGGTLFLDEIGDLPTESQRALLQVLQEGVYQRVGGQTVMSSKVRVIAATNRDLQQAAAAGTFREDLYYRLSPFVLYMPPLRERRDDISLLTTYFLERFSRHLSREAPTLSPEALALLREYDFPGNVRELEHVVQRAVLVCHDGTIRPADLSLAGGDETPRRSGALPDSLDAFDDQSREAERAFLAAALEACNGVVYGDRGAAHRLGVHPEKLRRRLRRAGLGA